MTGSSAEITALLSRTGASRQELMDELVPLVYDKLRRMAHQQLAREDARHTLNTTGLVHEAYLKLVQDADRPVPNRRYFFGAATRAMRQVVIEAARRRNRHKRGRGVRKVPLDESAIAIETYSDELVALDEALDRLASEHPRAARVVECRFFGGLSVASTAELLEVSNRTVKRDWMLARAWLHRDLERRDESES